MRYARALTVTAWLLLLMFMLSPTRARAGGAEVVIDKTGLHPAVLQTHVDERVAFVNRTGLPVHLQFPPAPDRHEVSQVPGQMSATFYVPGRHPYVAHVQAGTALRAFEGVIAVVKDPAAEADRHVPVCTGTTLSIQGQPEVCIER